MALKDLGGKNWVDFGGTEHDWRADNLNKLRPQGLVYQKPSTLNTVVILPLRWVNQALIQDFPGTEHTIAGTGETFIYLDGSQPAGLTQFTTSTVSWPTLTSGTFFLIARVTYTAGVITGIENLQAVAGAGSAAVTGVGATPPIQSSGGLTPVISIDAASGSGPGSLSSTDFNKLQNVPADTNNELAGKLAESLLASDGAVVTKNSGVTVGVTPPSPLMLLRSNAANNGLEFVLSSALALSIDEMIFLQADGIVAGSPGTPSNDPGGNPIPYNIAQWANPLFSKGSIARDAVNKGVVTINKTGIYLCFLSGYVDGATQTLDLVGRNPISSGANFARLILNTSPSQVTSMRFAVLDLTAVTVPYYLGIQIIGLVGPYPSAIAEANQLAFVKISD